jgi:hypothetical protein
MLKTRRLMIGRLELTNRADPTFCTYLRLPPMLGHHFEHAQHIAITDCNEDKLCSFSIDHVNTRSLQNMV